MIRKKLRSRRGLTLAETLAALAVFAILSVALVQGTTAAWKIYQKAVVASESRTLQSTLSQAISNELRYAENIEVKSGTVYFDSATYGQNVSIQFLDNKILIGNEEDKFDLVPKKAYTSGLKAKAIVTYENGFFNVYLTITNTPLTGDMVPPVNVEPTLIIQALNANP